MFHTQYYLYRDKIRGNPHPKKLTNGKMNYNILYSVIILWHKIQGLGAYLMTKEYKIIIYIYENNFILNV